MKTFKKYLEEAIQRHLVRNTVKIGKATLIAGAEITFKGYKDAPIGKDEIEITDLSNDKKTIVSVQDFNNKVRLDPIRKK